MIAAWVYSRGVAAGLDGDHGLRTGCSVIVIRVERIALFSNSTFLFARSESGCRKIS